jgi:hypothetical protein
LDEGDAEVEVRGVGHPQRAGVAGADGDDGPANSCSMEAKLSGCMERGAAGHKGQKALKSRQAA